MSTFWGFSHFLFKFKPFHEFSFQNVISNLSLHEASVCVCVGVYIHWIKMSPKLPLVLFFVPSSEDVRMGRFRGFYLLYVEVFIVFIFLSYCNFCSVCEKSFLMGKALNATWDKNKTEM